MLFNDLVKICREAEQEADMEIFERCADMVHDIVRVADSMMDAGYIENFEGDITRCNNNRLFQINIILLFNLKTGRVAIQ